MSRPVIVWVDDERVRDVEVGGLDRDGWPVDGAFQVVPVPSDDQLTRDLDVATDPEGAVPGRAMAIARLRAAFGLDQFDLDQWDA